MRGRKPRQLNVNPDDIPRLRRIARNIELPWKQVRLARVVLAIAADDRIQNIAAQIRCDPATVWRIAREFEQLGMACFYQQPRRNRRSAYQQFDAEVMADESLDDSSEPYCLDDDHVPGLEYLASLRQQRVVLNAS